MPPRNDNDTVHETTPHVHNAKALNPPPHPPPLPPKKLSVAVLARLQAFLPQMEAANTELTAAMLERPAEEFDIENVGSDDDAAHVEMDLGLGVVDLKTVEVRGAMGRIFGGCFVASPSRVYVYQPKRRDGG